MLPAEALDPASWAPPVWGAMVAWSDPQATKRHASPIHETAPADNAQCVRNICSSTSLATLLVSAPGVWSELTV